MFMIGLSSMDQGLESGFVQVLLREGEIVHMSACYGMQHATVACIEQNINLLDALLEVLEGCNSPFPEAGRFAEYLRGRGQR